MFNGVVLSLNLCIVQTLSRQIFGSNEKRQITFAIKLKALYFFIKLSLIF